MRIAYSMVEFDGFGRERCHTTEVWTTWIERAAGFAKTRESSKLTSNRTSPKPFGGIGSVKLDLDGALGDRGGQRDDQHDDKHRDEENSSPTGVEIHWYYCAWEPTLLFNNQQTTAFEPS